MQISEDTARQHNSTQWKVYVSAYVCEKYFQVTCEGSI